MAITKLDHFTVLTGDAAATADFYEFTLGLKQGPRPNFSVRGVWLYCDGEPVVHIVEKVREPLDVALDHVGFRGTDLTVFVERLKARGIPYDLKRLPEGGPLSGAWQLFFRDPNGARVEIQLASADAAPLAI